MIDREPLEGNHTREHSGGKGVSGEMQRLQNHEHVSSAK